MRLYQVTVAAYISNIATIAPIKTQNIPRLELQTTLSITKSMKNIHESLIPIIPINFFMLWE